MRTIIGDDGSTITYDDAGNVAAVTDNQGNPVAVAGATGSNVVQQFTNLLNYWANAAINSKYGPQPGTVGSPASTSGQLNQLMPLIIFGGLALFAYKTLAK